MDKTQDEPGDCKDHVHALAVFNPDSSLRQDSEKREIGPFGLTGEPYQAPSYSSANQKEEIVITAIRATDIALGLRRLPVGFFAVIRHLGLEWRTENKPSSVKQDVAEWNGPILISSDISATICVEVYASFEFQPMLGSGEQLRKLMVRIEELLERSEKNSPFKFFPKNRDVVSPCSSVFVAVKRQKCEHDGVSTSEVLYQRWSSPGSRSELEDATDRGHGALLQYVRCGGKQDLDLAIRAFEHALNICPMDHSCRSVTQSNLAMAKLIRFEVEGGDDHLEVALQMYHDALSVRPVGHPDRPSTLVHMATAHLARFQNQQARTLLAEVLGSGCSESHARRAASVLQKLHAGRSMNRGQSNRQMSAKQDTISRFTDEDPWMLHVELLKRFKQFGDLADLQQAIAILQKLVKSTSIWGNEYLGVLQNLSVALKYRFNRLGELADLEDAISSERNAVDLTPHGHPDKPGRLNNLGTSLITRFQRVGELIDLEDGILKLRDAVDLTPHGHPDKPSRLSNLGNSLITHFERAGELSALEEAISKLRDAVDLTPHGHPDKSACLNNLGKSLIARFGYVGELSDLEEAILKLRDAVDLTPHGHPDKPGRLNNLGTSLKTHFERVGELSDLEEAISRLRDAVDLIPHGHPHKFVGLNNLGTSLKTRFEQVGELSDLEEAISRLRDAVDLTPHGHPDKSASLNNLSISLITRFQRVGELSDLEEAISRLRDAIDLTPHGHPHKPAGLNNLGSCLRARFERVGELSDLEEAISRLRDAVDLTPHGHPDKSAGLNSLGNSLMTRFEHVGELSDLEEGISRLKDAVDLTPHGHPDRPGRLSNLGISLKTRFERVGELSDLEEAILRLRDAVDLTPHGHPDKSASLNNLGISLDIRFRYVGELSDIEEGVSRLRDAVDLTPRGHPNKYSYLSNLGTSLRARFERVGELSDLEESISKLRDAVNLTPHGHPDKPSCLNNLGNSFKTRFERLRERSVLEDAVSVFSHAASSPIGSVDVRFHASREWISFARHIRHTSLLHAYSVALSLIPQFAWIGLSLTRRYQRLIWAADIVREAAAAALDAGFPKAAVEWLEQGRSIVWGELFQLRSPYEELSFSYPEYAQRLRRVSMELDRASANREMPSRPTLPGAPLAIESPRQVADKHRRLAIERDGLLRKIRRLPGFEQFLRLKRFSQLCASAHAGPMVILNAAETRCDALIVLADLDHVIHVPLTKFTYKQSVGLQHTMKSFVREARVGGRAILPGVSLESILSSLWTNVVRPILDAMAFSQPEGLSRIFWCPTGPFTSLPIHAAGLYGSQYSQPGHRLSDFHISSYVPTLSILAPSPGPSPCTTPTNNLRILAVRQPPSDGLHPLSGVGPELEHIRKVIRKSPAAQTIFVESSQGTVEEVLGLMKDADWVHFACHGVQDAVDPTQSGLCLADKRRLALRDIIALKRSGGGLAFLSACETAKGDVHLSEEATHIAAGMLFAGYEGVVGTMWTISDRLAPEVAKNVYEYLFRDGKRPDYREAARALHEAIGRARREGASFSNWIPFIHLGL